MGVVFGSILDIWNSCILVNSNHRNSRSKSGICCRVRTSFPSCWCCRISVHVPTSFCCCGLQPVYTARKSTTDLEKISCRQVGSRSVTMSYIFLTAFSVVSCCVMSSTCSFLSHPFFCVAQGSILTLSLVHMWFCVKTLHLGTVSVCLAKSSPLRR